MLLIRHITASIAFIMIAATLYSGGIIVPLAGEVREPGGMYTGDKYFKNEWLKGDVMLENGIVAENVKLRYNGLIDDVFWLHEGSLQHIMLDRGLVSGFRMYMPEEDEKLVFTKVERSLLRMHGTRDIYVQVLYDDIVTLYAYRQVSRKRDVYVRRGRSRYILTELEHDPVYFFVLPGDVIVRLDTVNRRDVYRAFPGVRDELRSIFRQRRNFSNDEHLLTETADRLNRVLKDHQR